MGNNATQTVADQMDPSPSLPDSLADGCRETVLYQKVWTLRINADARTIRAITYSHQPRIQMLQENIVEKEAGDEDNRGAVTARYA
jgi:hypothetical protein